MGSGSQLVSNLGDSFKVSRRHGCSFHEERPPVTVRYLYATYILELINSEKTLVINSPQGLREANEKMYTLQFYSKMPETIVSLDKTIIRKFVEEKN